MSNFTDRAKIIPAEFDEGWVLEVDGEIQSHVDPRRPDLIRFEYLRRIGNILDLCWSPAQPLRVLHLGAGALTLVRYVQAARPGSQQTVIELDADLIPLVTSTLPLPAGTDLSVLTGDARSTLSELGDQSFDMIIVDIFTGTQTATHLTEEPFYYDVVDRLGEQGLLVVNIGDEEGLEFFAQQATVLQTVASKVGHTGVWTLADAAVLNRRLSGNIILATGPGFDSHNDHTGVLRSQLAAAGPHPATVLTPSDTESLIASIYE